MFSPSKAPMEASSSMDVPPPPPGFSPPKVSGAWDMASPQPLPTRFDSTSSDYPNSGVTEFAPLRCEIVRSSEEGGTSKYTGEEGE